MIVVGSMIFTSAIFKSLMFVLAAILLDFILGVLISIKQETFDPGLLPKFIATNLFPYVGGLVVLALSVGLFGRDRVSVLCRGGHCDP